MTTTTLPEYTVKDAERRAKKKNKAAAANSPLFAAMDALDEIAPVVTVQQAQEDMQAHLAHETARHARLDILAALNCRVSEMKLTAQVGEAQMQTWRGYFLKVYPAGWMLAGHNLANLWHGKQKQVDAGTFVPDADKPPTDPYDEAPADGGMTFNQVIAWRHLYCYEPGQPSATNLFEHLLKLRGDDVDQIRRDLAAMERHALTHLRKRNAASKPILQQIGGLFREETLTVKQAEQKASPLDYALPRALDALRAFAASSGLFDTQATA